MLQVIRYKKSMKKSSLRSECTFFFIILAIISIILRRNYVADINQTMYNNNESLPVLETGIEVRYDLVEDVQDVHVRFAAYYRNGGNSQDEWKKLSILHWAQLLSSSNDRSPELAVELTQVIVKACPSYDAFFFETKGASYNNVSEKQFEFILVNSHSFKVAEANPDPNTFKEYLNCGESMVCSFWNLGGTAKLIAPRQQNGEDLKKYSHLAIYLRDALEEEVVQIWGRVTDDYLICLKERGGEPVWLSTSGLGISWLHFRLDHRPKYYTFREFQMEK